MPGADRGLPPAGLSGGSLRWSVSPVGGAAGDGGRCRRIPMCSGRDVATCSATQNRAPLTIVSPARVTRTYVLWPVGPGSPPQPRLRPARSPPGAESGTCPRSLTGMPISRMPSNSTCGPVHPSTVTAPGQGADPVRKRSERSRRLKSGTIWSARPSARYAPSPAAGISARAPGPGRNCQAIR